MKALNIFIFSVLIISFNANATFSLVAYDENSGIYGVAFASCVYLPPNLDITDKVNALTPIGTITTQATVNFNNINLNNGKDMILRNVRGNQILEWLYDHDQDGTEGRDSRQFLILSNPSSGPVEGYAFTGGEVPSVKGSIIRDNLVIAGNTLHSNTLDAILDGYMEQHDFFVEKLLSGLTSVRDRGLGDLRCDGTSSYTAFIKINDRSWFYNSRDIDEDAVSGLEKIINERQKPQVCLTLVSGTAFLANIDIKGSGHYVGPYGVGSKICDDAKPRDIFTPQLNIVAGAHKTCPSVAIGEYTEIVNYDAWGTTFSPHCILKNDHLEVYADPHQKGESLNILQDISDLSQYNFSERISSFAIPHGWTVRFFEDKNFSGNYYTRVEGDTEASAFDNKARSVRILSRE
ncbi:DUF1028 domain-containing protein [Edwardsiella piscicida]|uniref:DUF1028 domain-containing protein n=1 Tax=Edwardsiella piscicida TaxID=1263550 RepID=UPI0002C08673|nr:DUF1028 domain-containing protein [Edwardsiella piscicida]AGH73614.1 hypothetical protein ETAC_07465 [Edwardsiella piscicida C07-087]EKS7779297.1 DUF1028 domain-containing protein [Edwardsiella piscicida]EKS7782718.1 DUF1028 domain-containing protein [Edwardsiella piscicida]UCQ25855.1 DUF1028 domain-containing protein [Edwardsiella piscicida]UCQ35998.1 DUF1028 domain-containing protein [Edwardsiella piscicida]